MEFDSEGDTIAILQDNCTAVTVINVYTKKVLELDIDKNNKDKPTCIRWGKNHPTLAIGTDRGLIYYYNKKNEKFFPVTLNHTKAVVSADWNDEGNLATGDENKSLSVTNRTGEPILQNATLKADPKMIKWARQKTSENKGSYTTISTVLQNKTILIYDIKKKSNPIELALDSDYGNIVTYQWFGDGYIAIGFTKGFISIISTHMTEIKNEVNSLQPFRSGLDDLAACEEINRLAVAGENSVKIYDTNTWTEIVEEKIEISNQAGRISKVQWSSTGQILIVSTFLGNIFAFNVIVNENFAESKNLFTTLCSLNEICTYEVAQPHNIQKIYQVQLQEEPRTFAVSQTYLAANLGMKIQIFNAEQIKNIKEGQAPSTIKDFSSVVSFIALNKEYLAILSEGRIHLLRIGTDTVEKIFPLKDTDDQIIHVALTDNFLIYSDSNNKIKVYHLKENCANICDFKFDHPIRKIFPNTTGTRFICMDSLGKGFAFSPVIENYTPLNNEVELANVLWDHTDPYIFATVSKANTVKIIITIG
jgi:WD repeat-containing protein 19